MVKSTMNGAIRCAANYIPLTPISFLERAALVYGDYTSLVYGSVKYTWKQTRDRCVKLASAIAHLGISRGDVVAVISPNAPSVYELHYAIPMAGAVICLITTHKEVLHLSNLIDQSKPKLIFVDEQYLSLTNNALELLEPLKSPMLVTINSNSGDNNEYESMVEDGEKHLIDIQWPNDEFDPLSIVFTSGTTGYPQKGVIHNHRTAYLATLSLLVSMEMQSRPVFLYTIPIYHCNGWGFIWSVAAQGGVNVILPTLSGEAIYSAIVEHNATHLAGTTPVMNMIAKAEESVRRPLPHKVRVLMGGSPPAPSVLAKMTDEGFCIFHHGGQTETYCSAIYCEWRPEWDVLSFEERAKLMCIQGVPNLVVNSADVKDPITMESVPADGKTIGEVMYRANTVLSGYLDRGMTKAAFKGGWFHSGDAGVMHENRYIEFVDRMKDIVICGGKMVGTIEAESAIFGHPKVYAAAVVGKPDEELGQTLCAFVQLKEGEEATEEEIVEFCRKKLDEESVPKTVVFDKLPVTLTGKTKKAVLREKAIAASGVKVVNGINGTNH